MKRIYFGRLFRPELRIKQSPKEDVMIKDLGIAYNVQELNNRTDWFVVTHSKSHDTGVLVSLQENVLRS